jgi:hypothetical protein
VASAAQATGASGSDTLTSIENLIRSAYADRLTGNTGNNALTGGLGKDVLTGSGGSDIFDFKALSEMGLTSTTWDVITDFAHGTDKLDLATLDADAALAGDQAFTNPVLGGDVLRCLRQSRRSVLRHHSACPLRQRRRRYGGRIRDRARRASHPERRGSFPPTEYEGKVEPDQRLRFPLAVHRHSL